MPAETRMFPLQTSRHAPPGPVRIPWSVAEKAYGAYAREYGRGQSLERLAERGGFGWCEMDQLHPGWRDEVSEICRLTAELDKLQAFKDWVHPWLDAHGVPHDPDPEKTAATGCRISNRMAWLLANR
jgi:hypothetical protein